MNDEASALSMSDYDKEIPMSEKVVAKFAVNTVEQQGYRDHASGKPKRSGEKVNLSVVYVDPKDRTEANENAAFWKATPSGQMWMQIDNPDAFGFFQPGEEVYVTFSKTPPV